MNGKAFYGWKLIGAFWVILFINVAFPTFGSPVLNTAMAKEFGFDRQMLGLVFAVFSLMSGLPGPLVALSVNRFGIRRTLALGSLLVASGSLVMAALADSVWVAAATFGIVVGAGVSAGGVIAAQTGAAFWFVRRRALATSILMTAGGAGGFVAPPLLNWAVASTGGGWRAGWAVIAALGLVATLVAILFVKDHPSELGQEPDGGAAPKVKASASRRKIHVTTEDWTLGEILGSPVLWLLMLAGVGMSAGFTTYLAHGVAHLQDLGHSPAAAATSLSVLSGTTLVGSVIAGIAGGRIDLRYVWAAGLAMFGGGLFLVIDARSDLDLYPYAILMGTAFGGSVVCIMTVLGNYYGSRAYASIVGVAIAIQTTAASFVSWVAGYMFDRLHSYELIFYILAGTCVVAAAALSFVPTPRKPKTA